MAQHDLNIANQSFPSFRTDLNNALLAIQTTHTGTTTPTNVQTGQLWIDNTNPVLVVLKYYDGADNITLATINHTANTVDFTDSSVTITGLTTTATGTVLTLTDTHLNSTVSVRLPTGTGIHDDSGNEYVKFSKTASAVNEFTVANSATANAPELSTTGSDTDIDLKITPKGAGNIILDGIKFPNADGTASQVLQTNGSGVLSFGSVGVSAGQVIQVVSTTLTTATSTAATGATDIAGLSVTITPSASANKILVLYKIQYSNSSGSNAVINLVRGATNIAMGDSGQGGDDCTISICTANSNNYWSLEAGGSFLDSPNTTSATTYKFQTTSGDGAGPFYFNRTGRNGAADANGISTITVMEIKG